MSEASIVAPQPVETRRSPMRKPFRSAAPKLDGQAAIRQGLAVNSALAVFSDAGAAIAFLNAHHPDLDARPIDLAVTSAAGLDRVREIISQARR